MYCFMINLTDMIVLIYFVHNKAVLCIMQYCVFQLLYDFKLKFGADKAAAVANNLKLR